jgi:hypothetical protein
LAGSPDGALARATVIAALIGLLATVVGALLGTRVGERRAADEVQNLEARLRQQENAVQALQAKISERDEAIRDLRERTVRGSAPDGLTREGGIAPSGAAREQLPESEQQRQDSDTAQHVPLSVKRLAPVDIALEKCQHWGGGLSCRLLLTNSGSAGANIALGDRSTFVYDERGNEFQLEGATLGSQRWSAEQFGAIWLEPSIPVAANFQFRGVPESAQRGTLRLVLAVVQVAGPPAFFGPNPEWRSIVFDDVPFT